MTGDVNHIVSELGLDKLEGFYLREDLISQAFVHPSYCMENPRDSGVDPRLQSNQRLEFLGDAILGLITALSLYRERPISTEGELTKMRSSLVREKTLAAAALTLGLDRYIKLGKGFAAEGGARQSSVLADTFEALIGALYICGVSLPSLETYVMGVLRESGADVVGKDDEDYKGQLQALVQKTNECKLSYRILDERGPDHNKAFLAAAFLDGDEAGRGWGSTKQSAEKEAAKQALLKLKESKEP